MIAIAQRLILICAVLVAFPAQAQLEITIGQGKVRGIPIAVVPFKYYGAGEPEHSVNEVINFDLEATGKFEALSTDNFLSQPSRNEEVRFKDWRVIDAEALVIGEIRPQGINKVEVVFRLYDVAREQQLGGFRYTASPSQLRSVAHEISDFVYSAFTERAGAFNSKIAYIRKSRIEYNRYRYRLMVADWDGYAEQEVYASWNPIISPSWSPDSSKIAFVSYKEQKPIVQVLTLATGETQVIAQFNGVNTAPAWSPDGTKLAYSTSRHGSPDIYVYEFLTGAHKRVTTHYAIDTEPSWSPDGRYLIFTSNRTRKPQIYEINWPNGEESQRVTFEGKENASASYDPEARKIVLVTDGGKIAVHDVETGSLSLLTNAKFDESPCFSPNGDMVLYVSEQDYEPALVVASTDGRVRTKLDFVRGDVREPTWSPLKN